MIIQPAKRMNNVGEYYFSKKLEEICAMNMNGKDVINLGIGSPDGAPADEVIYTLVNEARCTGNHAYQSYKGIREIREGFTEWYRKYYHVELNPETEVQPLAGSKEGIVLLSLAFLNKGDKVLIPDPGYPAYSSASLLAEADIIPYDLKEENGWMPDFKALERLDLKGVKMMWTNYPNMPTGAKANVELYRNLVDFGLKHGILICNDNPYSFILNDFPLSIFNVTDAKKCCVELNSLSKAHNMAGWRIGMVAGDTGIIRQILKVKSNMDSGMFKPLQLAAVKALTAGDEWYEKLNNEYGNRKKLAGKIFDLLEVAYDPFSSGMFMWGKVSPYRWKSGENLSDFILERANVFVTPGFIFGNNGDQYIRISLCADQRRLEYALERIRESLSSFVHGSWC